MKLMFFILFTVMKTKASKKTIGLNMEIEGEIDFKLKMPENLALDMQMENGTVTEPVMKVYVRNLVTAGPIVECFYPFPEDEQVRAILSNILNKLTKVFIRAQELVKKDFRRKGDTRFRVVDKKKTQFFEDIYSNMTDEYLKQYNITTGRVKKSENEIDPCKHQEEIKIIWKDLLDNSIATLQKSAKQCIEQHLQLQGKSQNEKARTRLEQFLLKEINGVRIEQLNMLCDRFQLCFNELLE